MDLVPPSKVSNGSGLFQNENGLALFKDEIPGLHHYRVNCKLRIMVYFALRGLKTMSTHTVQRSYHTGKTFYLLNLGKAGHGVTFDMSCMQIIQY